MTRERIAALVAPLLGILDGIAAEGADREAAALGMWWALVAACVGDEADARDPCVAAADAAVGHVAGLSPDPARWSTTGASPRDAGYLRTRELLPAGSLPEPSVPTALPDWATRLRSE